jgi:predicted DNA-binding protein (MmcQ/YjbR family)
MNIEELREICISKAGVTEEFPFDNSALVFKVMGKMFALTNIDKYESVNLKCDPERAVELRETYSGIIPGWHMNKTHWNTVLVDGSVDDSLLVELVQHSYDLVVSKLTKRDRLVLEGL